MNIDHPKYNKLVKSLIGKGTILKWREQIDSPHFKDNKVTFRVTSLKLNSWGSIYINLSVVGRIFLSWVITIPAGAILAVVFFFIIRAVLG